MGLSVKSYRLLTLLRSCLSKDDRGILYPGFVNLCKDRDFSNPTDTIGYLVSFGYLKEMYYKHPTKWLGVYLFFTKKGIDIIKKRKILFKKICKNHKSSGIMNVCIPLKRLNT